MFRLYPMIRHRRIDLMMTVDWLEIYRSISVHKKNQSRPYGSQFAIYQSLPIGVHMHKQSKISY